MFVIRKEDGLCTGWYIKGGSSTEFPNDLTDRLLEANLYCTEAEAQSAVLLLCARYPDICIGNLVVVNVDKWERAGYFDGVKT